MNSQHASNCHKDVQRRRHFNTGVELSYGNLQSYRFNYTNMGTAKRVNQMGHYVSWCDASCQYLAQWRFSVDCVRFHNFLLRYCWRHSFFYLVRDFEVQSIIVRYIFSTLWLYLPLAMTSPCNNIMPPTLMTFAIYLTNSNATAPYSSLSTPTICDIVLHSIDASMERENQRAMQKH